MEWPYQSTPYLSALPGVAGRGLDVSAGDKPSKIYLITSRGDGAEGGPDPRGPNCFAGTVRYCAQTDQGAGFHKYVVPLVGGYVYTGRTVSSPSPVYGRGDMDYIGHAAPGAGLFFQCTLLRISGGSNVRLWHLPSWMGDMPAAAGVTNMHAGNRDALQMSYDGYKARDCALINCEARFSMDEAVQVFYAMDGVSMIRCAIYDPLHTPPAFVDPNIAHHEPGTDHGYGHLIGGSDFCDNSLVMQSLYAHTTDRNPLVAAANHAHINNLHYDHGRPSPGGAGAGLKVSDNGGFNAKAGASMQCNLVGSVSVRGPNNDDSIVFARTLDDLTKGSTAHAALNSVYGWPSPSSQDDFFTHKPPGYMQPTLRTGAWPAGLGADYSGVLAPCRDPLAPTAQELLRFAELVRRTVGCMPARRYLYAGGVNAVCDQIDAAIRGLKAPSQWVNTVSEAGGWPVMPAVSVDPLNPGSEYHAPMPLGADRDEVLLSGTFSDGSSKVGYSRFRAWCIEEYFNKQGR